MKCVACAAGSATCDAWDDGGYGGYGYGGYGYGDDGPIYECFDGLEARKYAGKASDCVLCKAGKFAPVAGSDCIECPVGTYVDTPGATSCINCAAGFASVSSASKLADDCIACSAGQFNIAGRNVYSYCVVFS